jgi:hypothetical protein
MLNKYTSVKDESRGKLASSYCGYCVGQIANNIENLIFSDIPQSFEICREKVMLEIRNEMCESNMTKTQQSRIMSRKLNR